MAALTDLDHPSLGAVLKTALDAVVVMRMDGTIAGWNDVAERSFGWDFAEARGRRMSELIIPPHYREAHEKGLAHFLATGEGPVLDTHFEITALHRDGREFPVELSITVARQFGEPVFLGFLRDISERHEAGRRQALLLAELNHRVKNMLAVVSGIAHQTVRASTTLPEFSKAFAGRLESLARAHEILTSGAWERASLGALAEALLGSYAQPGDGRARIAGPEVMLSPRQFMSVSMILHELITNATKYGALSVAEGRIALDWRDEADGRIGLDWKETGLADIAEPAHRGFGSRMIALSVGHELDGTGESAWQPDGLLFRLRFRRD